MRAFRVKAGVSSFLLRTILWCVPVVVAPAGSVCAQPSPAPRGALVQPPKTAEQKAVEAWQTAVVQQAAQTAGCRQAVYPTKTFHTVPCGTVVAKPHLRPSRRLRPLDEAATGNHTLKSTGSITSATGTFPIIDNFTHVFGSGVDREFSIQMNTNGFAAPQCSGTTNAGCVGVQQFIIDSGGGLEIQTWLVSYLDKTTTACPAGNTWNISGTACWRNAATMNFPVRPFDQFAGVTLTGSATKNGVDTLSMASGKVVWQFSAADSSLGLAGNWNDVDFNVYGESNNEAVFNAGTLMLLRVSLVDGTENVPTCTGQGVGGAQTVETSNLTLGPCQQFAVTTGPNGMQFVEGVLPVVQSVSPSTGSTRGGTAVTITGTGLTKNMEAAFGTTFVGMFGAQCNGSTQCTVPAPAGTQPVHVTVVNLLDNGTPGVFSLPTSADLFSYQVVADGSMSPNTGVPAGGTGVTISLQNFNALAGAASASFGFSTGAQAVAVTCTSATSCSMTSPPLSPAGTDPAKVPVTLTSGGQTVALGSFTYQQKKVTPPPPSCSICIERGQQCKIVNGQPVCVGTIQ